MFIILFLNILLFYPKQATLFNDVKCAKFENDYKFFNDLWFHKKNELDFDRFLSPYFFIADKTNAKLYLYFYNGETRLLKTYGIVSGEIFGDKQALNDKKTPEGVYFFESYLSKNTLLERFGSKEAKIYGPLAITTNYPNPVDRIHNKTGNGIWLHGVEENQRVDKKFDTKGCIASANEDVPNIIKFVQTQTTPILIFSNFDYPEKFEVQIPENFVQFIEEWREAWENKDLEKYMSYYDENFIGSNKENKESWRNHKANLNRVYTKIGVELHNISFYKHDKYVLTQFYQVYTAPGKVFKGIKRIYLIESGASYKIISEEFVSPGSLRYLGDNYSI